MIFAFCASLLLANGILVPAAALRFESQGMLRSPGHSDRPCIIQALVPAFAACRSRLWPAVRASSAFMQRLLRRASRRASADASWCSAVRRRSASKCSAVRACSSCSHEPQTAYFSLLVKPEQMLSRALLCAAPQVLSRARLPLLWLSAPRCTFQPQDQARADASGALAVCRRCNAYMRARVRLLLLQLRAPT